MKRIVLYFIITTFLFSSSLVAQTANSGGQWTDGTNWVGGTSPGITGLNFPVVNIADIQDEIVASSLSFANANTRTLTVTSGTLIVNGDVTFSAQKGFAELNVGAGAYLVILGNLNMGKNQSAGSIDGVLVVKGNIGAANSGGNGFGGTGQIYSDGTTSNISGTIVEEGGTKKTIEELSNAGDGNILEDIEDYINGGGSVPLPVDLLTFDLAVNNGVAVSWSTVSEKDNDYFVLERSEDGKSFYPIAEIGGNGTTQTLSTYEYIDISPEANVSFYRLLQVDYDGAFEYFPAKRIEISDVTATNTVDIYPTLVTQGKASLVGAYPLYIENAYLYDLKGGKVDNVKSNLTSEGIFRYSLDVSDLKNGAYILKFIDTKGESFTKKFVIQN